MSKASKLSNAQAQRQVIARDRERMLRLAERARRALATSTLRLSARVAHSGQLLNALSYRGVLARGFALIRDTVGQPLHSATAVTAGMPIEIEFSDGRVAARAEGTLATDTPGAKPRSKRGGGPGQGDLF